MKTITVILFLLFIFFKGYSQEKGIVAITATIVGEINSVRIGKEIIKQDTVLILPNHANFCYDLVIDSEHFTGITEDIMIGERPAFINRKMRIVLNCN